jgi:hypothetical protein
MASAVTQPEALRAELERILASPPFAGCHRSQRFLRYVVENSLDDAHESLKEYAIAIEVFERDSSYDPSIDATVRVEAGRLRSRLRGYYADAGRNDALVIDVPKGGYRASFTARVPVENLPGLGVRQEIVRRLQRRHFALCASLGPGIGRTLSHRRLDPLTPRKAAAAGGGAHCACGAALF